MKTLDQTTSKINWDEQFKIRIRRNASKKHEIIKLLIVLALIEKHKSNLYWIRIYTEYGLSNRKGKDKITDVYFENVRTHEIICYEIQNKVTDKWSEETKNFYKDFDRIYFTTNWVLVKENDFAEDVESIEKQVRELVI